MLLYRWQPYWHALFYVTLVVATGIGVGQEDHAVRRVLIGVLATALAAWYWHTAVRAGRFEVGARAAALLSLAIGAALWVPLLLWQDVFLLMMLSGYALACSAPIRRAIPGIAAISGIIVGAESARHGVEAVNFVLYAGVTVALSLMAVTMHAIHEQSEQRRRLIVELDATRTELAESERSAGTLAERERLARDIHDTLAQGFTSIVTLTEAARAEFTARPNVALRHLEAAGRQARSSLDEARRVVWALRPQALEGGLADAVERLAAGFGAETGIDARSVVSGMTREIGPNVETDLLRVAQEALANVRKHAAARRVALTLTYLDDAVLLDVRDDGRGFDQDEPSRTGLGLIGMRERLAKYGATLTIESTPGLGTAIVACLPTAVPSPNGAR